MIPPVSGKGRFFVREIPPLLLLTLIGGALRFYNLNWDGGLFYHPDELNVGMAVERIRFFSRLDPGFFAYNGFSIYLVRAVCDALAFFTSETSWSRGLSEIILVARHVSAAASTLSIPAMFLLGRGVAGGGAGLLAAALTSFTVGFIQYAHFGVTESLLVLFLVLLAALSVRLFRRESLRAWLAMSVVFGLAVGTKTSALSFMAIPCALVAVMMFRRGEDVKRLVLRALLFALVAALVAAAVTPYSLINLEAFGNSMRYEGGVVSGAVKVPYNLQFLGTAPYLFFLRSIPWHTGLLVLPLGIAGLFAWSALMLAGREERAHLPFLVFGVAYFLYVGGWHTKFIRYMIPLYPVLILSTVWLLTRGLKRWEERAPRLLRVLRAAVLAVSLIWSAAFMKIHTSPSTRTAASEWMFETIPQGSLVLTEHWDYGLPSPLPKRDRGRFRYDAMTNYDGDSPAKIEKMARLLSEGDYLVLSSARLSGSIPKDPEQYPVTSKYYDKLFGGLLGYREAARFASYPGLFGFEIEDHGAEETFSVYDHPVVRIFVNERRLSPEALRAVLAEADK